MDAVVKSGGNPASKRQIQLGVENERVDARRDGRTCLAKPSSQAPVGTGEKHFPVKLITSSISQLKRLVHTLLLYVMTSSLFLSQVICYRVNVFRRHGSLLSPPYLFIENSSIEYSIVRTVDMPCLRQKLFISLTHSYEALRQGSPEINSDSNCVKTPSPEGMA